jgi:hypothetical protein
VTAGGFDTVIAGAGDRIDFTAAFEGLLKRGGAVLGLSGADVGIGAGGFVAGTTNVRFVDTAIDADALADTLQIDLNGDGLFGAAVDFQIVMQGVTTVTYNAAGDYFQLA